MRRNYVEVHGTPERLVENLGKITIKLGVTKLRLYLDLENDVACL